MINSFSKLDALEETPDFYYKLINPLADLNKMMMFVWAKNLSLKYKVEHNILYNIAIFQGIPYLWGPPLGEKVEINHIIKGIRLIQNERNKQDIRTNEPEVLYLWSDYKLFNQIASNCHFKVILQAKEYIYESSMLANLKDLTLRSKRVSKNRFIKKFNPKIKSYNPDYRGNCLELVNKWETQKRQKIGKQDEEKFFIELSVCKDALSQELPFEGVVGFIDKKIIGFSIGYKHTCDTFNCMFEKTDLSYPDASSYIFSELGNGIQDRYKFINAGEDWGVNYLAISKKKWSPIRIVPSYSIKMYHEEEGKLYNFA
jgi:hypothetical protein